MMLWILTSSSFFFPSQLQLYAFFFSILAKMVLYLIIEGYHEADREAFTTADAFWQVVTQAGALGINIELQVS